MRIFAFHLLNDFSGSPKVLASVLNELLVKGHHIDLYTSDGGILDTIQQSDEFHKHTVKYSFSAGSNLKTLFNILKANLVYFFKALKVKKDKDTVFFVNTILPIGAAAGAKLRGNKVVYHYHENAQSKNAMYRLLANGMQRLADNIICVSEYQASFLNRKDGVSIVPNAVPDAFASNLHPDPEAAFSRKNILMLGSLKTYKGVDKFIRLGSMNPNLNFTLVINDSQDNIDRYIQDNQLTVSDNIFIHSQTDNPAQFYDKASVVLNLTDKRLVIETFGLTAIEAFSAGLPVIVPTEGGIADIVTDGVNGYKIDVADLDRISATINNLLSDKDLYLNMASHALTESRKYREPAMIDAIESIIL